MIDKYDAKSTYLLRWKHAIYSYDEIHSNVGVILLARISKK